MTKSERQQAILNILVSRRHETVANLMAEFDVSDRTIRNDITALSCSYPIETIRGRHGGGIRLADWYRPSRNTLSQEQIDAILKAAPFLEGRNQQTLLSIISQFSVPV